MRFGVLSRVKGDVLVLQQSKEGVHLGQRMMGNAYIKDFKLLSKYIKDNGNKIPHVRKRKL